MGKARLGRETLTPVPVCTMDARHVLCCALCVAIATAALRGGAEIPASQVEVVKDDVAFVEVEATTGMTTRGASRSLGMRGDFTVQGTLKTSTLTSPIGDVSVSGTMNVISSIECASAKSAYMKVEEVTSITKGITSKEDQLLVLGEIDADSVTAGGFCTSFLEIDNVRQWSLVTVEDFEEDTEIAGWDHKETTECAGQKFLGGPCTKGGDSELSKTYTKLPPHTQLRIPAKYMFIDSWDGESAYMKVNDSPVWADTYNHAQVEAKSGINVCGNGTPEGRFMRNIDVTVPHNGPTFDLKFGATTDEHSCDESFGVDSVMVFVR